MKGPSPPDAISPEPATVLSFWFDEIDRRVWWRPSRVFDKVVAERFAALLRAARRCELFAWRATPEGRLAEILTLDQFARHIFREQAEAFEGDALALGLAQSAVAAGADLTLSAEKRAFLYMPYVHSESRLIHVEAERLLSAPGLEAPLAAERRHKAVIDRFGRYPHRNASLGRTPTPEECAFLEGEGRGF